jgi:hypothetical protein
MSSPSFASSSSSSSSFEALRASSTLPCASRASPLASRVHVAVCRAARVASRVAIG